MAEEMTEEALSARRRRETWDRPTEWPMQETPPSPQWSAESPFAPGGAPDPSGRAAEPVGAGSRPPEGGLLSGEVVGLLSAVLDAADVATRSAGTAAATATAMKQATGRVEKVSGSMRRTGQLTLAGGAALVLATAGLAIFVALSFGSRASQLDSVLLVAGKKLVELNSVIASAGGADARLVEIERSQRSLSESTASIAAALEAQKSNIARLAEAVATAAKTAPAAAAAPARAVTPPPPPQVASLSPATDRALQAALSAGAQADQRSAQAEQRSAQAQQAIAAQVRSIDSALREQSRVLAMLQEKIAQAEATAASVAAMRRELASVLEAERRQRQEIDSLRREAAQRAAQDQDRSGMIQYPSRPATQRAP